MNMDTGLGQQHRCWARLELPQGLLVVCVCSLEVGAGHGTPCKGQGTARGCLSTHFCRDEGAVPRWEAQCQQLPLSHQTRPDILQRWSSLDSHCSVSPGYPAFLPRSLCGAEHPPASHSMTHSSVLHHCPHLQFLLPSACLSRQPSMRNSPSPELLSSLTVQHWQELLSCLGDIFSPWHFVCQLLHIWWLHHV